jgi:hypothetical protein
MRETYSYQKGNNSITIDDCSSRALVALKEMKGGNQASLANISQATVGSSNPLSPAADLGSSS